MTQSKASFLDEWAEPLIFGGLAVACLVIYSQVTTFDFINLDDPSYVYKNGPVLSGLNADSIKWAFTAFHSSNWHPLTWFSHALDVQLFGLNPGVHHAVNVILHLANACLAFVVFRTYTGSVWKSALVALLFAVHPAHVESVAWVSERKDVLSTLFWLLTMLAYARYARTPDADGSVARRLVSPYLLLTYGLLALGLLAKPMVVTLPFVLLLMDLWPLKRLTSVRGLAPLVLEKLPMFALVAASSVLTFLAQKESGSVLGLQTFPLTGRIMNAVLSYAKYLVVMFYPADLGVWYPFQPIITPVELAASGIALVAITAIAIWQIRARPYITVGWFWYLGTLVPVIGLVQVGAQSMADRYTYIPYFGLFLIVVWGLAELVDRFKIDLRVAGAAAAIVVVMLAVAAFRQTSYWKNNETLYQRTISVTKDNYFLMNLLCRHYVDRTPAEYAERRCTELLDSTMNYAESHTTIGLLRVELGRYDDAIVSYRKALQIKPGFSSAYVNLSVAYARKGDAGEAEKNLQRAIELADESLDPKTIAHAFNAVGEAYAQKGDAARARSAFENAIRHDPELVTARQNLIKLQEGQQ